MKKKHPATIARLVAAKIMCIVAASCVSLERTTAPRKNPAGAGGADKFFG
jgi:hypothetical protein